MLVYIGYTIIENKIILPQFVNYAYAIDEQANGLMNVSALRLY